MLINLHLPAQIHFETPPYTLPLISSSTVIPIVVTGIPKDTVALLIMIGGILEVPCRIGNGWLADKQVMTALNQYCVCVLISGSTCLFCAAVSGIPG